MFWCSNDWNLFTLGKSNRIQTEEKLLETSLDVRRWERENNQFQIISLVIFPFPFTSRSIEMHSFYTKKKLKRNILFAFWENCSSANVNVIAIPFNEHIQLNATQFTHSEKIKFIKSRARSPDHRKT